MELKSTLERVNSRWVEILQKLNDSYEVPLWEFNSNAKVNEKDLKVGNKNRHEGQPQDIQLYHHIKSRGSNQRYTRNMNQHFGLLNGSRHDGL